MVNNNGQAVRNSSGNQRQQKWQKQGKSNNRKLVSNAMAMGIAIELVAISSCNGNGNNSGSKSSK